MRVRFLVFAVALIQLPTLTLAQNFQNPLAVDFCDLVRNAVRYAGTEVEVRGRIILGFEDFTMQDDQCSG